MNISTCSVESEDFRLQRDGLDLKQLDFVNEISSVEESSKNIGQMLKSTSGSWDTLSGGQT